MHLRYHGSRGRHTHWRLHQVARRGDSLKRPCEEDSEPRVMMKLTKSIQSHREIASPSVNTDDDFDGFDVRALVARITEKRVLLGGLLLLAIAVAWRIDFLSHLYFRLDDFIDLDIAIQSPFNWKYVTYNGVGHLIIGVRALGWFLARTSLYNWPLDSAVDLIIVALSGLAAL